MSRSRPSSARPRTPSVGTLYAPAVGSATVGADEDGANGLLTFGPRETEQTTRVDAVDDEVDDPAETLTVTLRDAVEAALG